MLKNPTLPSIYDHFAGKKPIMMAETASQEASEGDYVPPGATKATWIARHAPGPQDRVPRRSTPSSGSTSSGAAATSAPTRRRPRSPSFKAMAQDPYFNPSGAPRPPPPPPRRRHPPPPPAPPAPPAPPPPPAPPAATAGTTGTSAAPDAARRRRHRPHPPPRGSSPASPVRSSCSIRQSTTLTGRVQLDGEAERQRRAGRVPDRRHDALDRVRRPVRLRR